jgi:PKHD-type hydroxylase
MIGENPTTKNELNEILSSNTFRTKEFNQVYSFSNSFDDSEIQHIIDYCSTLPAVNAEIGSDMESEDINEGVRSSIVRWVPMNEETKYIYERLINMALEANNELWGFDVNSIIEEIQYTEYYGTNDGHYDWHLDIGDEIDYRKISITVQLSDKDEYEGGHLEMKTGPIDLITPKEKGLSTIFPSFMLHRVNKVKTGLRRSLVLWISGPPLR